MLVPSEIRFNPPITTVLSLLIPLLISIVVDVTIPVVISVLTTLLSELVMYTYFFHLLQIQPF